MISRGTLSCRSSPAALWAGATDTERLNRALGLEAWSTEPSTNGAAHLIVHTRAGGLPVAWEEQPFEWEQPRYFRVRRNVLSGPLRYFQHLFEFAEAAGGGTELTITLEIQPKLSLLKPYVRFEAARTLKRMQRHLSAVDAQIVEHGAGKIALASGAAVPDLLEQRGAALTSACGDPELAARLLSWIQQASDLDVSRIRPFELAEHWQKPREDVLRLCLHGVEAGVLELYWDLICPSCRTTAERRRSLSSLSAHAHCQFCDINYDVALDQAVEAAFRPPAVLRAVDDRPYCSGGPARTPHVLVQKLLPAGGEAVLTVPDEPGRYRLFARGGDAAVVEVSEQEAAGEVSVEARDDGIEPGTLRVAPGASLRVLQPEGRDRHVKLERVEWTQSAATAHDLALLEEFRSKFAREVLRPGLTLSVARVALLFTDLTGSTAMYSRLGDARAFEVVQEHFELLFRLVEEHSGVVVKTIGDAVMASFQTEAHAARCAVAMHQAFPEFRRSHDRAAGVRLKIGLFAGACYVVTANGVLDYFGQTVNVAARLQGASEGGDCVVTSKLAQQGREAGWWPPDAKSESFAAELKGLDGSLQAERIWIDVD